MVDWGTCPGEYNARLKLVSWNAGPMLWMVPILYHNRLVVASEVRSSRWCYDRTFNLVSRCIEMNRKVYIEENQLTGQRVSGKHPGETGPNIP